MPEPVVVALWAFAGIRTLIGLSPLVAAEPMVKALRFPATEVTASALVMGRLFGVRDIGLGVMIAWSIGHPDVWLPVIVLNALTDLGDFLSILAGLRGRPDLRPALIPCATVAGSAIVAWGIVAALVAAG